MTTDPGETKGVSLDLIRWAQTGRGARIDEDTGEMTPGSCVMTETMPTSKWRVDKRTRVRSRRVVNGSTCFAVFVCLATHANRFHLSWPSQSTIARETALSTSAVEFALDALKVAGFITATGKPSKDQRGVRYKLNSPDLSGSPDTDGRDEVEARPPDTGEGSPASVGESPDSVARPPDTGEGSPASGRTIRSEPFEPFEPPDPPPAEPPDAVDLIQAIRTNLTRTTP